MGLIDIKLGKRDILRSFKISPEDLTRNFMRLQFAFDDLQLKDLPTSDAAYQTISQSDRENWDTTAQAVAEMQSAMIPIKFAGQLTLVNGIVTFAITGLLETDLPIITPTYTNDSDISATNQYQVYPSANSLTITAIKNDSSTNTTDQSTINYIIVANPNPTVIKS